MSACTERSSPMPASSITGKLRSARATPQINGIGSMRRVEGGGRSAVTTASPRLKTRSDAKARPFIRVRLSAKRLNGANGAR